MTHILRFHTEIGKMPVILDSCPWPRLACAWPWPRIVCPWPRKNFEVFGLGLDLKVLGLTTTLVVTKLQKLVRRLDGINEEKKRIKNDATSHR